MSKRFTPKDYGWLMGGLAQRILRTNETYAPIQRSYATALAGYEAANSVLQAQLSEQFPPTWDHDPSDAELDRLGEVAEVLALSLDLPTLRELLKEAEEGLLDWFHAILRQSPGYNADVAAMFASNLVTVRNELLELALQLDARTLPMAR